MIGSLALPRPWPALLASLLLDPASWLLGCAGFLARGGIVVVALEVWSVPNPAAISLLIPPTALGPSGISPGFAATLVAIGLGLLALAVGAGVVSALTELLAYERLARALADPNEPPGAVAGRAAPETAGPRRAIWLTAQLVLLEALALMPAVAAAVVAVRRLVEVGRSEYLVPSSLAVPFVVRVVDGAHAEVLALVLCLLLAEFLYAIGARWLLRRSLDRPPALASPGDAGDAGAPARRGHARRASGALPYRMAAIAGAWLAGWAATVVALAAGFIAARAARSLLDGIVFTLAASAGLAAAVPFVGSVALLVAAWLVALLLAGGASAVRGALWTAALASGRSSDPSATLRRPAGHARTESEEAR